MGGGNASKSAPRREHLGGQCWTWHRVHVVVIALFAAIGAWLFLFRGRRPQRYDGFVTVNGTQLELHCRPFYISGFNTHDLLQNALIKPADYSTPGSLAGDQMLKRLMDQASKAGLNVARTWAHTNHASFPFQGPPGRYDTWALAALDLVVESARRRGMRLILSFVDNWKYYNGVDQYIDWSSTVPPRSQQRPTDSAGDPLPTMYRDESVKEYEAERHMLFYTDEECKANFKAHIEATLNRVNSYSGKKYKDDSTIMAWNLLNEPRCETWKDPTCGETLQAWLEEMTAFLKERAPRQIVMIGSEGFFSADSPQKKYNPQSWAEQMGQNFTGNNLLPAVDMAGMHVWPNNWERTSDEFLTQWIESHVNETTRSLGKPLLLEEFGKKLLPGQLNAEKIREVRDPVYRLTYKAVEKFINAGSPLVGSLYWRWDLPMFTDGAPGEYGVSPKQSTFEIIKAHSRFILDKMNSVPPRASCRSQCWIPKTFWGLNRCVQDSDACLRYWDAVERGRPPPPGPYFTSHKRCCLKGLGAFEAGCSWLV